MRRNIPSNASLIAFEAAARHGSFARAADELALTEGAISRQISRLEALLGIILFERIGNRVRLLPNGMRYASQVREFLNHLDRNTQYLIGQRNDGESLDIAISPTFAMKWLIPRLSRFQQMHPNITVHLAERLEPFALIGSGFDAAIHFEHPAWTGMRTYPLLDEVLIPVCHPTLLAEGVAILDDLPRLHRRQNPDSWQHYSLETGIHLTNPAMGARYDLHAMLIEAALSGLGVALVPRLYVENELALGKLVAPWPERRTLSKTFCLILPELIESSGNAVQFFVRWIQDEAKISKGRYFHVSAYPNLKG